MNHADTREGRRRVLAQPARGVLQKVTFGTLFICWQFLRLACCAVLVLLEPLLRMTLVPIAFLSFMVTLIFGFLIGDPRFPRWGMLAFSIGTLMIYWMFLGLMSRFMTLPRCHEH